MGRTPPIVKSKGIDFILIRWDSIGLASECEYID